MMRNKLFAMLLAVSVLAGCSSSNQKESNTSTTSDEAEVVTLYSNAEVKDVMTGDDSKKIGEYTLSEVDSSLVDRDSLTDYIFNYFLQGDYNYGRIIYTDTTNPTKGVNISGGMVETDVTLELQDGEWEVIDSNGSTTYLIIEDEGKLMTYEEIAEANNN